MRKMGVRQIDGKSHGRKCFLHCSPAPGHTSEEPPTGKAQGAGEVRETSRGRTDCVKCHRMRSHEALGTGKVLPQRGKSTCQPNSYGKIQQQTVQQGGRRAAGRAGVGVPCWRRWEVREGPSVE